jgi:DNA-directed RNA polymerase subunit RPC12/RpoP
MPDYVNLTCPSCGGRLQVTNDLERFACGYCGHELLVRRGGGIVSLAPVVEGLDRVAAGVAQVRTGVDRTASELAIPRLEKEIASLSNTHYALPQPKIWLSPILYAIGGLTALYSIASAAQADVGQSVLGVAGSAVLWLIAYGVGKSERRYVEEAMARRNAVARQILDKQDQLARHKAIVSRIV